jgi:hypothetical protein
MNTTCKYEAPQNCLPCDLIESGRMHGIDRLNWNHLRALGKTDSAGRWYPTDPILIEYCSQYRSPSRAWPLSYAKACLTQKCFKHLRDNHGALLSTIIGG